GGNAREAIHNPVILRTARGPFAVHGGAFLIAVLRIKSGLLEVIAAVIQRFIKLARVYLKEIIGLVCGGKSIRDTRISIDKFLEAVGVGIFFRPEKQHVLQIMRKPGVSFRAPTTARSHSHGNGRYLHGWIGHQYY